MEVTISTLIYDNNINMCEKENMEMPTQVFYFYYIECVINISVKQGVQVIDVQHWTYHSVISLN